MNKYINALLQIQDISFVLHENDILHKEEGSKERISAKLGENIKEMREILPKEICAEYDRIANRYDIFVTPMINKTCTGCFMKLPVGVANNVNNTSQCISCPSCHRFLYEDYQTERPGDNLHYKGVARFSSIDLMIPEINAKNHADALTEIGKLTGDAGFVENGDSFSEALLQREALGSTAVGSGLAFPHARNIRACGLTLTIAVSIKGIDFGDGEKVKLIFASAVPPQTSMFYMELVAKIARYFGRPENVQKMIECKTADEMWKIFVKIGK